MAIAFLGLAVAGIGAVKAASNSQNPMSGLVETIANKFNLNASDVQQVIDEQRTQRQQERQAGQQQQFTERLSEAVTSSKITQAQADLISAKRAEIAAEQADLDGKTQEERQALREQHREEMKQWMSENNIPENYMMMFGGFGIGKGPGGRGNGEGNGNGLGQSNCPFANQSN
ncbi:MAG: hypothetical protein UV36_C0007G0008 [Parcubacteria group bacterium GW2011_GWC2_42_6]|nr:MAG: hypothetical protein UU87_C0004G0022 [Parcubacteria group bacterium GW2011_GWA2_42_11]KKS67486.1 MAG: hypothetical protein UV36_C0007G0008 [Parcubacteria group bacterium GW2011_GWC2_42_6]KKT76604.1 MAG: hypothetical protein UW72_C0004G0025 [Parcubacteria group bacterium GW2011_GWF2_44_7]